MISTQVKLEELLNIPALSPIPQQQLEHLATVMVRQTYSTGQFIFLEGEESSGIWFVESGRIKIMRQSFNGRIQGLCMMHPSKCFGSCPLFNMESNPASAQAVGQVTLLLLPQERLNNLMRHDTNLVSVVLRIFSQRLGHLAHLSQMLGTWNAADRINDCLITYAEYVEPHPIVRLTHEKLAHLAGTVREVVTRHLVQLEQAGSIQLEPGQITLLNLNALSLSCAFDQSAS